MESASSGLPPMAKTSLSAFVAAIAPKSAGSSTMRREEVGREDERALVVELVDGGVVGRVEPDEEVLRRRRREAGEELLEPGRRVLRRAPASGLEAGEPRGSLHAMELTASGVSGARA